MRVNKKVGLGVAIFLSSSLLIVGCGQSNNTATGSGLDTITYWGWVPYNTTMPSIIADFNKKYPNVKVNYQIMDWGQYWDKLSLDLNNGAGPDVFAMNMDYYNQYKDNMLPLDSLAAQVMGSSWKDKYNQDMLQKAYVEKDLKVFPEAFGGQWYLFYNKSLIKELGYDVPKTYADWVQFSQKVGSKTIPVLYGGKDAGNNAYLYFWLANNIKPGIVDDVSKGKAKFTDPQFKQAFTDFQKLIKDGVIPKDSFGLDPNTGADALFKKRQGAAVLSGFWSAGSYLAGNQLQGTPIQNDDIGVMVMPNPEVADPYVVGNIDHGFAINSNSQHKQAAMEFISELTQGNSAKDWINVLYGTPVAKDITLDTSSIKSNEAKQTIGIIQNSVTNKLAGARGSGIKAVDDKAEQAVEAVVAGSMSVDDAMKALQSAYDTAAASK